MTRQEFIEEIKGRLDHATWNIAEYQKCLLTAYNEERMYSVALNALVKADAQDKAQATP